MLLCDSQDFPKHLANLKMNSQYGHVSVQFTQLAFRG
uniref:Uncharacterized protein n=1 Tax=Anguilla anguilla TaxID=7936 RepID=A0A0E9PVH3_ANGAN